MVALSLLAWSDVQVFWLGNFKATLALASLAPELFRVLFRRFPPLVTGDAFQECFSLQRASNSLAKANPLTNGFSGLVNLGYCRQKMIIRETHGS